MDIENEEMAKFPLPEDCITSIISFTSPKDACTASAVSSGFKVAAESDTVWDHFLPTEIQDILERSPSPPMTYSTKKELFLILSNSHLLLDQGKLSFSLSKSSGKKCYMLSARQLHITWSDTPEYWKWTPSPESRFDEVPQLLFVCWLEIRGKMQSQMLSFETSYAAYLVFKIADPSEYSGLDVSSKASINILKDGVVEEKGDTNIVCLKLPKDMEVFYNHTLRKEQVKHIDVGFPQSRTDGWMEIKLGKFFNGKGEKGIDIDMQLLEIEHGHSKFGLIVEGIEIRPVEYF